MRRIFACLFVLIFGLSVIAADKPKEKAKPEEKPKPAKIEMKVKATKNELKQLVINLSFKSGEKEDKKVDYKIAYIARSTKIKNAFIISNKVERDVDISAKKSKDVNNAGEYTIESMNKEGQKYAGWMVAAYADGELVAVESSGCTELKKLAVKVFEQEDDKPFKVDKTGKELEGAEADPAEKPADKPADKPKK